MSSSVTARNAEPSKMKATYWVSNLTGQVKFADALTELQTMKSKMLTCFDEIGPHSALRGPAKEVMESLKPGILFIAFLNLGVPDFGSLLSYGGQIFALRYLIDLAAANQQLVFQPLWIHSKRHGRSDNQVANLCMGSCKPVS